MSTSEASSSSTQLDSDAIAGSADPLSKLDSRVLWRITLLAMRHPGRMALGVGATIFAAGFQLFVPQFIGKAVDQAYGLLRDAASGAGREQTQDALLNTALILVAISLMRGLFTMIQNYQGETIGHLIAHDLRLAYYRKLQKLSIGWHAHVHSGDLMTRGMLDIEGVRVFVSTGILRAFLLAILIGGGFIILFRVDSVLCILALGFVPFVGVSTSIARIKLRDTWLRLQAELSVLTKAMEENLGGLRVVRAFAAQPYELSRFDRISRRALKISHERIALFVRNTAQMTYVFFLAMGLVLWIGGQKTLDGEITLGQLAEFLAFMTILQMPIRQIGWMSNSVARASTCGGRLFNVLDLIPSIMDGPDAGDLVMSDGVLRFENVDFSYPAQASDSHTLSGIDFQAGPGRTIGIVGPPGSGKSTIAQLIGRFYEVGNGRITIDGQDIRDVTLASLRQKVSIIQQEAFLFTASIGHNVAYGDPWASQPNIERSATMAQLHSYITSLPTDYATLVGERGLSLSGGQRQRMSIARGILPDSAILVFDDSTAAVDAATEALIHIGLQEFARHRAVIIIAHRLSSLRHAHEILFLEQGRIVERGTQDELLALNGRYAELHRLQSLPGREEASR
ncbi:MAG: ABC transporter ATP-binding protein [Rhodobacteraceae bacterium]|nr:ABC transporter ATP-binding protein [Paracoccaceae bacterium]MCY4141650.1 ABC transporter ATP-binding protein [Paracoccaceae bacterium]